MTAGTVHPEIEPGRIRVVIGPVLPLRHVEPERHHVVAAPANRHHVRESQSRDCTMTKPEAVVADAKPRPRAVVRHEDCQCFVRRRGGQAVCRGEVGRRHHRRARTVAPRLDIHVRFDRLLRLVVEAARELGPLGVGHQNQLLESGMRSVSKRHIRRVIGPSTGSSSRLSDGAVASACPASPSRRVTRSTTHISSAVCVASTTTNVAQLARPVMRANLRCRIRSRKYTKHNPNPHAAPIVPVLDAR